MLSHIQSFVGAIDVFFHFQSDDDSNPREDEVLLAVVSTFGSSKSREDISEAPLNAAHGWR